VPEGVEIIEGNGAYLMPGLAYMHMHFGEDEKMVLTLKDEEVNFEKMAQKDEFIPEDDFGNYFTAEIDRKGKVEISYEKYGN
jgi:imidazolonepropionase-like amidohydrolase